MVAVIASPLPPPAPGPEARKIVCRCGVQLGVVANGCLHLRHKGRGVDAYLPVRVQCDKCGRKTVVLDSVPLER